MALAPYFGKAALGAAALLQNTTVDELTRLVGHLSVTIRFAEEAATTTEGRVCLDLLTNLISRFYPAIAFHAIGDKAAALVDKLTTQARQINPCIEVVDPRPPYIAVGRIGNMKDDFTIFIGSQGWICHFSTKAERSIGISDNPFGAAAAACFAAAGMFRHLLGERLATGKVDEEFALSLQDYTRREISLADAPKAGSAQDARVDLGELALVGAGAIGNATLWTLSKTQCSGRVHVIDPETVDDTNPQRYILTNAGSSGTDKVTLAREVLQDTALRVDAHKMTWSEFISSQKWESKLAAVALDSAEDRIAVQASLPRYVLNAWTQANDLGVSRHVFSSESACLACLYWPTRSHPNEDEIVMKAINFSGELMEIRNMLYFRTPLDKNWLERLSRDVGQPLERLMPFLGQTLDTFYREGVCGGHIFATGQGNIVVPMAFQSALAGVMLAREIVGYGEQGQTVSSTLVSTKIDLLRPLGTHLSEKYKKRTDVKCICSDDDFQSRYKSKYA